MLCMCCETWNNSSVQHVTMIYFHILLAVSSLLVITGSLPGSGAVHSAVTREREWLTNCILSVWHEWGWWLLFPRPWYQLLNSSKQRKEFLSASIKLTSMTRWIHYCGVMRAAATHTPSPTFTTSSSSALRSADCTLQFPEDRISWRRHGDLLEDPADDQEDHQDPGLRNSRHRHRGAGHADQVRWW